MRAAYRVAEVAEMLHPIPSVVSALGVSRATVYRLIASGSLRTVHIGTRTFVTDRELRAYLAYLESRAA